MSLVAKANALKAELDIPASMPAAAAVVAAAEIMQITAEPGESLPNLTDRVMAAVGCEVARLPLRFPLRLPLGLSPRLPRRRRRRRRRRRHLLQQLQQRQQESARRMRRAALLHWHAVARSSSCSFKCQA